MKREIILEKELFEKGMKFYVEWNKPFNEEVWESLKGEFDKFVNEINYLWNSIFTRLDDNAIDYIRNRVVESDLEEEYLQYSDLSKFLKEYFGDCNEITGINAVCGLALLKTVYDVIEPWINKERLKELKKEAWDLDDSLLDKAVEIYTAYCDKGCKLFREDKEKLGFYEFQKTVDSKWFGLFTTKATDVHVYEMRDAILEKYYSESYVLNDVKDLIESYKNNKEFFFPEMLATLSNMCAKMYTAD